MSDPQPKKPFVEPHLVVYGDIQQITHAIGMVGAADSGKGAGMDKTR